MIENKNFTHITYDERELTGCIFFFFLCLLFLSDIELFEDDDNH
jgi:hypothetical protein